MSITGGLLAFGVRYVFNVSADHVVSVIEKRMTDHSQALPKALSRANDRAWTAVGLALNGDSLFDRVKDIFRDADMKGVRDQIKNFLNHTPTGLEDATASIRAKASEEWTRLRKAGRFVAAPVSAGELARRAATMERHGDTARITATAHHAVKETAEALRAEAPVLAELLTAAPTGGTPLLAASRASFRLPKNGCSRCNRSNRSIIARSSAEADAGYREKLERFRPSNSHCRRTLNSSWVGSICCRFHSQERGRFFSPTPTPSSTDRSARTVPPAEPWRPSRPSAWGRC